jgi:acyl-CoA thioester hydrolase
VIDERRPPFRFSYTTRVGFDETDAQAVVYYGRYMPYFDRARVEYLRHLGLLHAFEPGREFVMRANRVDYHAPARFDDLLDVFLRVERIGTSSVVFRFEAHRQDGELLVAAEQTVVQIDIATRRPVTVAERYRSAVELFEGRAVVATGPGLVNAVRAIVERGDEADEILREIVATVARRLGTFCGIRFVEEGTMVLGPSAGAHAEAIVVPISYDGALVAELVLGTAAADPEEMSSIAALVSPYCLVGWDTQGETWNP